MSKIVISGYYGFANAGDEAMLTAIVKSLRKAEESVDLTVISGNPHSTATKHQVASIHRFSPLKIYSALASCDLLLSGGGSLLQDVTSKKSLLYYLAIIWLGKILDKKVMLFAHGIGPIRSGILRKLTKFVCSKADLITVRDTDSLEELERLGVALDKVRLTADAVLTLAQANKEQGVELLQKFNVSQTKPVVAISVRSWGSSDKYLQEIGKAADALVASKGVQIVLLPLQYPADVIACKKLQQFMKCKEAVILDTAFDTEQFLALMGNFSLLIGMRLHALIFAAVMEIPFIALSYDPKIDGFVKEVAGTNIGAIESLAAEDLLQAAQRALEFENSGNERLAQLRTKALENAQLAFNLLR
ncbi:MAG: polysaccharide pyruvyl transferase CsaB [Phascolarctobacterium sp.]|nr:polysaccharide pyruvyl transferase CsaB [Phascolarctobacterium sp.]